jgi:hypothetical protein
VRRHWRVELAFASSTELLVASALLCFVWGQLPCLREVRHVQRGISGECPECDAWERHLLQLGLWPRAANNRLLSIVETQAL